jgi:membrane-associated protease RseP (regulator of RpoE activity)
VLLAEPQHTPYDLHFSVFGFPVRVHPWFWVMGLFFGFNAHQPIMVLIAIFVIFVSVLIHELGHALMMRRFGREAHVVLYGLGGLAIEGGGSSFGSFGGFRSRGSRTTAEQVLISAAGPGAGYVLAAVTIAILYALGGHIEWQPLVGLFPIPIPHAHLGENLGAARDNLNLRIFLDMILWFNVVWGTVNLLPVFPLDGGQIAQSLMVASDPWGGLVRSLWLSIITGVGMAIVGYVGFQSVFIALLFLSLAYSNYVALQQVGGGGRGRPW